MVFTRKYRPWWVILPTIFTFPIGLLWLLITDLAPTISIVLEAAGNRTHVRVVGKGEGNVSKAFDQWQMSGRFRYRWVGLP